MTKPHQPNQSIISAVECLSAVTSLKRSVSAREISEILGKNYTHTHRVLKTLLHMGILNKTFGNKYIAGYGLYMLSAQAFSHSGLLEKSIEVLRSCVSPNLILAVGVLFRNTVWYIIHTKPGEAVTGSNDIFVYDARKSSIATCLSAFMHEEVLIDFYKTPHMKKERSTIKEKGYFYDSSELENSIAFPIAPFKSSSPKYHPPEKILRQTFKKTTPIAGIAFVDRSQKLNESEMQKLFSPSVLSLCEKLYQ